MTIFTTLRAALDAGFSICDRTEYGYLVHIRTQNGWAMAVVDLRAGSR